MKIFIYLLMFIAVIPFISAPGEFDAYQANFNQDCEGARFCGTEELACSYITDGICPEDFGDWESCTTNNYGKKCGICDPDCGNCGQRIALDVPDSNSNSQITINVNAYGYPIEEPIDYYRFRFYLVRNGYSYYLTLRNVNSCPNGICSASMVTTSSQQNCKTYTYKTTFYSIESEEGISRSTNISTVFDSGKTTPFVNISQDENTFNVEATCNGDERVDVERVEIYLEKRRDDGTYAKINPQGQECNTENCNRLSTINQRQGNYFVFNLNDNAFENGEYRLIANAISERSVEELGFEEFYYFSENQDDYEFTIDNGLEGATGGTYQGSKVLNIVLAKIKTWI